MCQVIWTWSCFTYSGFCSGCKSFAAGRSNQGLLAKLFTIGGRHSSLKFPVHSLVAAMTASMPFQQQDKYLILDKAFLATLIVPNGSFDFFSTMSCSKSSRKITHLGVGCMAVSKPFFSHQACMHALDSKPFRADAAVQQLAWHVLSLIPATSTKQCRRKFSCCLPVSPIVHDAFAARCPEHSS